MHQNPPAKTDDTQRRTATQRFSSGIFRACAWAVCSIVLSCSGRVETNLGMEQQAVIYGLDNRQDWYTTHDNFLRKLAIQSTVALMIEDSLIDSVIDSNRLEVRANTFGDAFDLCASEAFTSQPSAAACSGVLVDDDLVLTAAHCLDANEMCQDQIWAFDFAMARPVGWPELDRSDVYRCRSVPLRTHGTRADGLRYDYALVQLDRPVSADREVVSIAVLPATEGATVFVIGYPGGLPVKIDAAAQVLDGRPDRHDYLNLTADTSVGSSGSGVFDERGHLIGIQVRGRADYSYDQSQDCNVSNRILDTRKAETAEQASYAAGAIDSLCASGWASSRLCGRASVCGDGQCSIDEHDGCLHDCPAVTALRMGNESAFSSCSAPPSARDANMPVLGLGIVSCAWCRRKRRMTSAQRWRGARR